MTGWRTAGPDDLLGLWHRHIGSRNATAYDRSAFVAMLERHTPVEVALAVLSFGPELGSPRALEFNMKQIWEPLERIEAEAELAKELGFSGFLEDDYATYIDLRDGLGIPNADLTNAFESAKERLEVWLDTVYSQPLTTPSGAEPAVRRAPKPRKSRSPSEFGYIE